MTSGPSVNDLQLVLAIAELGSVSRAARELRMAQPSASQRLAAIERRCGSVLFERDTTGARATAAGSEMARQARHILGHLDQVFAATAAASSHQSLRIGTFVSLAPSLFPAIEQLLDHPVSAVLDHGPELIEAVAEGAIEAAVVAVAEQVTLPRSVAVQHLGEDPLVILRTAASEGRGRGRTPLKGRRVVYSTYDRMGPVVRDRLERLGAVAQEGPTLATTLALARSRGGMAVLPRSAVTADLRAGEAIESLPFAMRVRLSLVTARVADPRLTGIAPALGRALRLAETLSRSSP